MESLRRQQQHSSASRLRLPNERKRESNGRGRFGKQRALFQTGRVYRAASRASFRNFCCPLTRGSRISAGQMYSDYIGSTIVSTGFIARIRKSSKRMFITRISEKLKEFIYRSLAELLVPRIIPGSKLDFLSEP